MVTEAAVKKAMKKATEPATGITLFDLGFIDDVKIVKDSVFITVVPHCNCPFMPILLEDLYRVTSEVPGVESVEIEVNWEAQWHKGRMTVEGKKLLGICSD